LDLEKQVRTEGFLSKGGSGVIYKATLLDPELIKRHQTEKVVVKHIPGPFFSFKQQKNTNINTYIY